MLFVDFVILILSGTIVLVFGCKWPCLAVVKPVNKWTELLYVRCYARSFVKY
jgi:hypothetical protein